MIPQLVQEGVHGDYTVLVYGVYEGLETIAEVTVKTECKEKINHSVIKKLFEKK